MIKQFYLALTDSTTPGQSGPGSNGNEGAFYIPQNNPQMLICH